MKKIFALVLSLGWLQMHAQQAFEFNGTNNYISFGLASGLGSSTFTLECWFKNKGVSANTTTTGTGGVASVIPLVSKGRGESDGSNKDMNYLLGINTATMTLCADFEEGAGQPSPGLNHPVYGVTALQDTTWYHAAVTFDGVKWKLYLNGNLEAVDSINVLPQAASIQHAAIASALTSTGVAQGYFKGIIDEVRIWNYARTMQEIRDSINTQVPAATGLVGRWAMDDVSGTTIACTGSSAINGNRINNPTPVGTGAPYNITFPPPNDPPAQPTGFVPADNTIGYTDSLLKVTVTDPDTNNMKLVFMGREKTPMMDSPTFTIIPIPDVQFYTSHMNGATNATFKAQTTWIRSSIATMNIVYAIQLGDCVQNGDNNGNDIEWKRADTSFRIIEDPATTLMPYGLPYGICVGNHDQSPGGSASGTTTFYNQYFGSGRFTGRNYYGGHYGSNNDNHFQLFSASGLDFIAISLEYDTNADTSVLNWADSLLKAYPNRRGILSSHWIINSNGTWGGQGQAIYNKLKSNMNLDFMLCGHINPNGEARRSDTYNGHTVHTLLSDYQDRTNGGNGWLRIMEFSPYKNEVSVKTYSPTLNKFETDANSQFTLSYQMSNLFDTVGVVTNTASGTSPSVTWSGLKDGKEYEWYVIVDDGIATINTPIMDFSFKVVPIVGVNDVTNANDLQVYPNPNDGRHVMMSYPRTATANIQVVDVTGKKVYGNNLTLGGRTTLPVNLLPGHYFICVQVEGKMITKKLLVQ
ncbi:LamG-like jellyroll fold domain-containing protein [Polluticoccus soli]|uniref:LamG-like jellyroll fold domain-containing protein n=1 Tax=Polluticoccus soli TaxID=3034150 RepID=UPI0023E31F43|nr:LamG-like jellyroll fold domain-containing protein [Flavipsychrobacter sp. JY13-12]